MPRPLHGATLAGAVDDACRRWAARVALVAGDRTLTYADLHRAVESLAARYRARGVRPGDRVVCQMPNRPEHLVAAFAAWRCGAVHVGVHPESTARELAAVVELTEPVLILHDPGSVESPLAATGQLDEAYTPDAPSYPTPDDPAAIFLTSGSTGRPKLPLGFHGRLCASWSGLSAQLGFGPDDVHLGHLPLAHGFGLMLATAGLLGGGRIVLVERFSAEPVLETIARARITVLHGSATHFRLLLARLDRARHDVSSLRIGVASASAFSPQLLQSMRDALGMELLVMYGSSEGVGVATRDPDDYLRGSVGRPAPGSVAIMDPDHVPLPADAEGEIAFSRAFFPVRYWRGARDGAPDVETVTEGWYHTGDLGRLDRDGRLFVLGRLKHQINRGGSKIDPVEVEDALLAYPGVADAAVVGVPHPVLGETVCAYVVADAHQMLTLDGVRDGLRAVLAPYKLPQELRVVERIPRTALGKVDVERLRAEAAPAVAAPH